MAVVAVVAGRDQAQQQTELAAEVLVVLLAPRFFMRLTQFLRLFTLSSEPLGLRVVEGLPLRVLPEELGATARSQPTTPTRLRLAFMP